MSASPPLILAVLALLAALLSEAFVDHALADGAARRLRPPAHSRAHTIAAVRTRGGAGPWR